MSSNFVLRSYISGVQQYLHDAGHIKYANEQAAEVDNAALAGGLESKVPELLEGAGAPAGISMNNEAMASEGMPPEINATVAKAVAEMAAQVGEDAQVAKAKAEIIENAAVEMAGNEKVASVLVVSGQGKGSPVANDSKEAGKAPQENSTEVPTDAERTSERTSPGTQADAGKGMMGLEGSEKKPVVENKDGMKDEISSQVPSDATRVHATTAPGTEEDKNKGEIGSEEAREKISHILDELNIK